MSNPFSSLLSESSKPAVLPGHVTAWRGVSSHCFRPFYDASGVDMESLWFPELNPVETVFKEIRRWAEGRVYESIGENIAAVDAFLLELASNPSHVWPGRKTDYLSFHAGRGKQAFRLAMALR